MLKLNFSNKLFNGLKIVNEYEETMPEKAIIGVPCSLYGQVGVSVKKGVSPMHVPSINFSTAIRRSTEELSHKPVVFKPVSHEPVKHYSLRELIAMHPFGREVDPREATRLDFVG